MVKKLSIAVMAIFMMVSLAACGNSNSGDKAAETVAQTQAETENTEAEMSEITEAAETEVAETEVAETEAAETETAETEAVETDATEAAQTEAATGEATAEAGGSNSIVVYFSWSGNTRTIAEEIQNQTGADIF